MLVKRLNSFLLLEGGASLPFFLWISSFFQFQPGGAVCYAHDASSFQKGSPSPSFSKPRDLPKGIRLVWCKREEVSILPVPTPKKQTSGQNQIRVELGDFPYLLSDDSNVAFLQGGEATPAMGWEEGVGKRALFDFPNIVIFFTIPLDRKNLFFYFCVDLCYISRFF